MFRIKPCSDSVWLGQTSSRSRFVLVDCGRWNSNSRVVPTASSLQIARQRSSERRHWRRLATPLPLMCELFTGIKQGTVNAFTSPRATSILPIPTIGNNTNRGRNSWEDKP
ncbi:hypothetical protein AVEN_100688-1 [Araneus ventricosus]|uniref:Uncharacterized protein n=1 Tax=Araneus ventricosus TaxID=182803 RepID=A0A4Y2CUD9_ARAVE|nr:hypothetical protein AVEN_100688-1 [Araneus ventricosus]